MKAEELKDLISTFLTLLEIPFSDVSVTNGQRTVISIITEAEQELLGQDGDTLRAFTLLVKRLVEQKHGLAATMFIIDINGKQEALLDGVRQQARMFAQRARLFKQDVALTPMSSYERLVIHELFAQDAEIKTESAGDGKLRHIVLKYSGA